MPRHRERDIYARTLRGKDRAAERFVDLCVEFVDERDLSLVFSVGGRWDRKFKCWSDDEPETSLQITLHPGQIETAVFFREWFQAYLSGDDTAMAIYSVLLLGGSRAGKTAMAKFLTVAFMVAVPGARVWLVQPTKTDEDDELENEFDEIIPEAWCVKSGKKYKMANGTTAVIRSGKYPHALKKGRCDWAFLNEGQNVKELAHSMLRMRTSDTGGLVVIAANPPNNNPDGQWVADYAEQFSRGERQHAKVFNYDPRNNPHVKREQLLAIAEETDQRTYEIEVLGKVLPPSNAVYHAFSPMENVDELPDFGDLTTEFAAKCGFGSGITNMVGLDFQRSPHMAASVAQAFHNPDNPERPLLYYRKAILVDLGDEYDLSDALYEFGLDPTKTMLVGDASGEWQDADRTKGGRSFQILRDEGWKRICVPDRNSKKNPPIPERMKNDNRLFLSEAKKRLVFIDPKARELIEAVKLWRNAKNGLPSRDSKYAHLCDSMSYLNWRVYPRKTWKIEVGYKRLKGRRRGRQMRGL